MLSDFVASRIKTIFLRLDLFPFDLFPETLLFSGSCPNTVFPPALRGI
jgi:hypothetical protein